MSYQGTTGEQTNPKAAVCSAGVDLEAAIAAARQRASYLALKAKYGRAYSWRWKQGRLRVSTTPRQGPSVVPRAYTRAPDAGRGALIWLLPWDKAGYPGIHRGMVELLGGRATWFTIRMWRHRGWPEWALEHVLAALEARLRSGQECREALVASARRR